MAFEFNFLGREEKLQNTYVLDHVRFDPEYEHEPRNRAVLKVGDTASVLPEASKRRREICVLFAVHWLQG